MMEDVSVTVTWQRQGRDITITVTPSAFLVQEPGKPEHEYRLITADDARFKSVQDLPAAAVGALCSSSSRRAIPLSASSVEELKQAQAKARDLDQEKNGEEYRIRAELQRLEYELEQADMATTHWADGGSDPGRLYKRQRQAEDQFNAAIRQHEAIWRAICEERKAMAEAGKIPIDPWM